MMKNRKRNLTVLAVLSFVCAAVALNWTYNSRWGKPDAEMVYAEDEAMEAAQMDFARSLTTSGTEYFAEASINHLMLTQLSGPAYILAAHAKLGFNSNFTSGDVRLISNLITEHSGNQEIIQQFRALGMQVYLV